MRTPLAWKNLTTSWRHCGLAATGVGFAVVLMFMQIGFRNALIDNNLQLLTLFEPRVAQLMMVSRARYNLATEQRFPRHLLEQAAAIPGVVAVSGVSLERGTAKVLVEGHVPRPLRVIGVDLQTPQFFRDAEVWRKLQAADARGAGLVDTRSKSLYGFAPRLSELRRQHIELNGRHLPIDEQFELGTDFANDGTLLLSQSRLAEYFPWRNSRGRPDEVLDLGLIATQLASSQSLVELAARLEQLAPEVIEVRPSSYFVRREKQFWANNTPIGKIFLIGTLMGLVVGAIICYQIQFTDISEHMAEFATLKAMGYGTGYFWSLIAWQSFYLACLGFLPGILVAQVLYALLAHTSGLVMSMSWDRIALVWGLTLVMCAASGIIAIM